MYIVLRISKDPKVCSDMTLRHRTCLLIHMWSGEMGNAESEKWGIWRKWESDLLNCRKCMSPPGEKWGNPGNRSYRSRKKSYQGGSPIFFMSMLTMFTSLADRKPQPCVNIVNEHVLAFINVNIVNTSVLVNIPCHVNTVTRQSAWLLPEKDPGTNSKKSIKTGYFPI